MDKESQNKALDSVTDHHEEAAAEVDGKAVANAMKELAKAEAEEARAALARKKELDAVKVDKESVEALMKEFELSASEADLALREKGGDLEATLKAMVKGHA